jgi:diguanylate cyclase (GGDEF)-like protein
LKEFIINRDRRDASPQAGKRTLLRVDDEGVIRYADAYAEAVLGFDARQLIGKPLCELAATRQDNPFTPAHRDQLDQGEPALLTLRHRDGFFFTALFRMRVDVVDGDEAVSSFISPRGPEPLDPRLLEATETSGQLGIWQLDVKTSQVSWSDGLYRLFELRPGTQISPDHVLFYFQDHQNRVRALIRRCLRNGASFSEDMQIATAQQQTRPVRVTGRALYTGAQITAVAGTLVDLSDRLRQRQARNEMEQILHALMAATNDLIMAVSPELKILTLNAPMARAFELTFGVAPKVGDELESLLADFPNERRLGVRLWKRAMSRESFVVEMPLARQNRELPVFEARYQCLRGLQGQTLGAVQVARDITHRLHTGENLDYLSRHDPVTGLLNRRELLSRLQRALNHAGGQTPGHALLYIDLDHFARFAGIASASAGENYLRKLSAAMAARIRQRDALARIATDKFALMLDKCSEIEARGVARSLIDQIGEFELHVQEEGVREPLQTTASGSLVHFGPATPCHSGDQLMTLAQDLCQTARQTGRGRVHVHRGRGSNMLESEVQALRKTLQACISEDRIALVYQPIRPVASATWGDHIEVLARLEPEATETGFWLPEDFLPIAERFDLTLEIDRRVIEKTVSWLRQHPLLEPRLKYCGFNLSLASLLDDNFPVFMHRQLQQLKFSAACFCFEIRESDATQYPDALTTFCEAMHELGCRVALDGAGASVESFTLVARLPVDVIKLHESLMRGLRDDPVQHVMVEALHRIAETAGKTTVATVIEDDETLRQVRRLGIHFGQGFRLSRPQPLQQLAPVTVDLDGY